MWWYFLTFWLGAITGFLLYAWIAHKFASYGGTIYVTHNEEKTLYSLELNDYPETIEFQKEVVFKVDASDVSLDRD